jgi:hypothetical protein
MWLSDDALNLRKPDSKPKKRRAQSAAEETA